MSAAPVVLFVYNRKNKTIDTLDALNNNYGVEATDLIIFADGAKSEEVKPQVNSVRDYIKNSFAKKSKFKSLKLIESENNKGLAKSIIDGVSEIINQYGKVIVVEDDLITAPDFLAYMNKGLDYYENMADIGSISGYSYPISYLKKYKKDVYILRKGECWGWATWKDRWENVDWEVKSFDEYVNNPQKRKEFDSIGAGLDSMLCLQMKGEIDSWAVRWCYHLYCNKLLTVYPRISKTQNIGFDGTGTHCTVTNMFETQLADEVKDCRFEKLPANYKIEREIVKFELNEKSFWELAVNKIKTLFGKRR